MKTSQIRENIAKGTFRPHTALTDMAIAYYQSEGNYFARSIFPTLPVRQSSDEYYVFDKEDLLRDNWQRKPAYGSVTPAVLSEHTDNYACKVDQIILGSDDIRQTDVARRMGPGLLNPDAQKSRTIADQANIHQDVLFAKSFFKTGVWSNEFTGVDSTTTTSSQFIKFSNGNSDPIALVDTMKNQMQESTGRTPNRLALGANVYKALKNHEAIKDRVRYGGSTANPATVNLNVLAQLFEVERVVVMNSIANTAGVGETAKMGYIADPDAFLLAYATPNPSITEPSAGYTFTWDMLGDGTILPVRKYEGPEATHSTYFEGLMASDMRKTADDLGMFFASAV